MKVIIQLFDRTCTNNNRSHTLISQYPCQCHFRQSLPATDSNFIQAGSFPHFISRYLVGFQEAGGTSGTRIFRNTMQIFVCQQPLRQRRESNETGSILCCQCQRLCLDSPIEHTITILAYQTRSAGSLHHFISHPRLFRRIF